MNSMFTRYLPAISVLVIPFAVAAQGSFDNFMDNVSGGLNTIIVFLFLVATVIFIWGVVKYIAAGGDEEKTKEARSMIIWGIIFLAVMVAVWGFVNIVLDFIFGQEDEFDIRNNTDLPQQP